MFINIACVTWLCSYIIAMVDVLVLRKKYPDFPRLWKVPFAKIILPIGMIGALFAIFTLRYVFKYAAIVMVVVAIYAVLWNKAHNIPINQKTSLEALVSGVRDRSEYLPVWDEAVEEWLNKCKEGDHA
jgi:amino acid transporter